MGRSGTPKAVRPRTVVIGMVAVIVVVGAVAAAMVWWPRSDGRVRLAAGPRDAVLSFAGVFPEQDEESLANPIGIAFDGEYLYVAESDAGAVRIFDTEGGSVGTIVLPVADGQRSAYPSVVAVAGGRLAIVDNAAGRVVVVDAGPADPASIAVTLGAGGEAPRQATAVTYAEGEFFVADAADKTIKVYDDEGVHRVTFEPESLRAESTIAALCVKNGVILASGSSSGEIHVLDSDTGSSAGSSFGEYPMARTLEPVGEELFAIVDGLDRAVTLTDASGAERATIDADSVQDARMSSPRGAAWVLDDGRLYVTDSASGRVFVYNVRLDRL